VAGRNRPPDDAPAESGPRTFADAMEEMGDVEPIDPSDSQEKRATRRAQAGGHTQSKPATTPPSPHAQSREEAPDAGGRRPGLGARDLRRLRAGKLRPEESIDLHGLTRIAARERLHMSLTRMSRTGVRCVLVIHGRGNRSESGEPILKAALQDWLEEPPLDRIVVARAPARPRDGGEGATYLVLR
jgi:DNA-nicking Smr family endonuclease